MVMRLQRRSDGVYVDLPDDEVTRGIASGEYAALKTIDVPVRAPDGEMMFLKPEVVEEYFRDHGYTYGTKDQFDAEAANNIAENRTKHFGGIGGVTEAAVLGAAETVSGGLSTMAAEALQPGYMKNLKEENPIAYTGGQVAGAFTPIGRGSSLASAATTAAAAKIVGATRVGAAASKAAPALLKDVARAGIATGLEGAVWGAQQGITEAVIGDPQSAADALAAIGSSAATGLYWGGGLGTGFAAIRPAAGTLWNKLAKYGDTVESRLQEGAKDIMLPVLSDKDTRRIAEMGLEPDAIAWRAYQAHKGDIGEAIKEVKALSKIEQKGIKQDTKELLYHMKTENPDQLNILAKGLNETGGDLRKTVDNLYQYSQDLYDAQRSVENGFRTIMVDGRRQAQFQDIITGQIEKFRAADRKDLAEIWEKAHTLYDDLPTKSVVDEMSAARRLRRSLGAADDPVRAEAYREIDDFALSGREVGKGNPIEDLRVAQKATDDHARASYELNKYLLAKGNATDNAIIKNATNPAFAGYIDAALARIGEIAPEIRVYMAKASSVVAKREALSNISATVSKHMGKPEHMKMDLDTIEELVKTMAPKRMGDITKLQQRAANLGDISQLGPIEKYIKLRELGGHPVDEVYRNLAKYDEDIAKLRKFDKLARPLQEHGPGMDPIMAGSVGYMAGGPMGVAAAAAVRAGVKAVKNRSNPMFAVNTIRATQEAIGKARRLTAATVEAAGKALTSQTVRRVATGIAISSSLRERREKYPQIKERLATLSDPNQFQEFMSKQTTGIVGIDNLKTSMIAKQYQMVGFLSTKLPQDPFIMYQAFGQAPYEPSDAELAKFYRYVDAADAPLKVVEKMADGTVTLEEMETLHALHPDLVASVQDAVMQSLSESKKYVPYEKRLALGQLFDIKSDMSLEPSFIVALQAQYDEKDKGGRPQGTKSTLDPMETVATEAQRVTYS